MPHTELSASRPAKLWEITVTAYKTFYVEATSQEEALLTQPVEDEQHVRFSGDFDWEHDETRAQEVDKEQAEWISKQHPELLAK